MGYSSVTLSRVLQSCGRCIFFFLEILVINSTEPLSTKCIITLACTLMGNGGTRDEKSLPLQVRTDRFLLASEHFCRFTFPDSPATTISYWWELNRTQAKQRMSFKLLLSYREKRTKKDDTEKRSLSKRVMGVGYICVMRLNFEDYVCTMGPGSISWLLGPSSQRRSLLTASWSRPWVSASAYRHVGARRKGVLGGPAGSWIWPAGKAIAGTAWQIWHKPLTKTPLCPISRF